MLSPHTSRSPSPPAPAGEIVASSDNRWLKKFRAALRRGEPCEDGAIGVEGARLVEDALRSGLAVEAVLVSASGERYLHRLAPWLGGPAAVRDALRLLRTSDKLFATVADTKTPQGVAALLHPRAVAFEDVLRGAGEPLVLGLIGVQDPGNVGTVIRTAEAFGATGAVATIGTAHPWQPKALRASAGSALRLPILAGMTPAVVLAQLRVAGVKLYAAALTGGMPPQKANLREPVAILVGNEGAGLPSEILRSADAQIRIPLSPAVDSLNAAVAAAVLLYEAARQRGLK